MIEPNNDALDYFRVIWKRKWLIIIPVVICTALVTVWSLSLPLEWEVDCILKPSQFFVQTSSGAFQEISVIKAQQITELINNQAYDKLIAEEFNVRLRSIPKIKAEELNNTQLIRVSLRTGDIERGRALLLSLFRHLRKDLDKKIELEIKGLETLLAGSENMILQKEIFVKDKRNEIKIVENEIKNKRIDIQAKERQKSDKRQEILSKENLQKISIEREDRIQSELDEIKQRVKEIEDLQVKLIGEGKKEDNTLSLLLYSNEIQKNMSFYSSLERELGNEKIRQENLSLSIKMNEADIMNLESQIEQIKTQIDTLYTRISDKKNEIDRISNEIADIRNNIALLNERKSKIDYSQLVKEPTPSNRPVSPKRKLNVLIAFILGLAVFTLFAFVLEYIRPPGLEDSSG